MTARRRNVRHRLLAGVAALGIGAAVALGAPIVGATDAAWTDQEHSTAELRAATLVSPSITSVSCDRRRTGSSQRLSVRWTWPGSAPAVSTRWTLNGNVITPTTTTNAPNDFTSVISDGLTSRFFGRTHTVELRAIAGNWQATDRRQVTLVAYSLLSPSCTVTG